MICKICKAKICAAGMKNHIINAAESEAFANAMGDTTNPRHLIALKAIGWQRPKDRGKIKLNMAQLYEANAQAKIAARPANNAKMGKRHGK